MRKKSYCRYRKMFGYTYLEIINMTREDFANKTSPRFLPMTSSKFKREIARIAGKYERGGNRAYLINGIE